MRTKPSALKIASRRARPTIYRECEGVHQWMSGRRGRRGMTHLELLTAGAIRPVLRRVKPCKHVKHAKASVPSIPDSLQLACRSLASRLRTEPHTRQRSSDDLAQLGSRVLHRTVPHPGGLAFLAGASEIEVGDDRRSKMKPDADLQEQEEWRGWRRRGGGSGGGSSGGGAGGGIGRVRSNNDGSGERYRTSPGPSPCPASISRFSSAPRSPSS
jgi:hypothetical protein